MARGLSSTEHLTWVFASGVLMNFSTVARVRGAFSIDQLREALAKVGRRHPLLAVRPAMNDQGRGRFVTEGTPDFPLRVIEGAGDSTWLCVIGEELGQPFSWDTGALVRFIWVRGDGFSDLVVICHHAVADGLAGAYVMRDLLHHLGNPDAPVEVLPVLPAVEALIPPEVEAELFQYTIPELVARLPRPPRRENRGPSPPWSDSSGGPPRFCISAWSLDEPQTAAVVTRARAEGTTVHGALGAAFLLTFADLAGNGDWERIIQSPVSLRDYLSVPVGEAYGTFMTLVMAAVDCAPGRGFWQVARDVRENLRRQMTPDKLFTLSFLWKSLRNLPGPEAVREQLEGLADSLWSVDYDLSLSNLGRLDFPITYGSLRLEAFYGPTFSAQGLDRIVGVNTVGGKMHFTLIFQEGTLDPVVAERIRTLAMARLDEAVRK